MGRARFLIVTGTDRDGGDSPWFGWRLLSANNRELGRSSGFFPRHDAAVESMVRMRAHVERAVPSVYVVQPDSQWRWRIDIDEHEAARSSRAYHRLRECRYNLAHFLAGVLEAPTAQVGLAEPRPAVRHTGRLPQQRRVVVR